MKRRGRPAVPQEIVEKVVREYVETDKSIFEICDEYKISYGTIVQKPEYRRIMHRAKTEDYTRN